MKTRLVVLTLYTELSILFQLEQHNHELEIKNEVLTDQVEILRERLQALPAFAAKEILRQSQQVGTCLQINTGLNPLDDIICINIDILSYSHSCIICPDNTLTACYICSWVKAFIINPELRILRLTFHRKSALKC